MQEESGSPPYSEARMKTKLEHAPKEKSDPVHVVRVTKSGFSPDRVPVKVGEVVRWQNDDKEPWNVTFDEAETMSVDVAPGGTFDHTVTAPGDHPYHCKLHPGKTGTISAS